MAQNEESSSPVSGVFGPTLIVLLGGLLAYLTHESALESRRPDLSRQTFLPEAPTAPGMHALHARLWDDPLAVAYEDSKSRLGAPSGSWLKLAPLSGRAENLSHANRDVRRWFKAYVENFVHQYPDGRLLCLPVMVPGEPYDSDTELRKRITYAVLSALANCGYELAAPDRVSYVEVPVTLRPHGNELNMQLNRLVVPVKVFQRTEVAGQINHTQPDGVVVMWINESQLGQWPAASVAQILEGCFGSVEQGFWKYMDIRILGPTDSTTLLDMAREDLIWNEAENAHREPSQTPPLIANPKKTRFFRNNPATLYSFRATISSTSLDGTIVQDKSPQEILKQFTDSRSKASGLSVIRTIGSDLQLARLLAHELKLRGAWPPKDEASQTQIVLITESDTLYGQAIPAAFRKVLRESGGDWDSLQVFTYLRGLDDKVPEEKSKQNAGSGAEATKPKDSEVDALHSQSPESIPASGRSQFDYLRRLEQQLVEFHQNSLENGEKGIRAIGVVGSDIYDKLLILRALRKRFPGVWFFSTDVDASLSLPSEYPTVHNLLVASHFGLRLNPKLQRTALPFRDGYQTSAYFSTLLALRHTPARQLGDHADGEQGVSDDPWGYFTPESEMLNVKRNLQPLVFEIGRSGPYQLTTLSPEDASGKIHPESPRKEHWLNNQWHTLGLLILALLAGIGTWWLSDCLRKIWECHDHRSRWISCVIAIEVLLIIVFLILVFCAVVPNHMDSNGEPFVLFEGISIWPSTLLRYVIVMVCVAFAATINFSMRGGLLEELNEASDTKIGLVAATSKCSQIFETFQNREGQQTCLWALLPAFLFIVFGSVLCLWIVEPPFLPYRGCFARGCAYAMLFLAGFATSYLISLVVIRVESCRRFAKEIGGQKADWSSSEYHNFSTNFDPIDPNDALELLTVRVIAKATEEVGKSIKYPFIALFLLILSRHPIFDMLELPWSLCLLWGLIVYVLCWTAHAMRRDARNARNEVVGRLRMRLSTVMNPNASLPSVRHREQLQQYIAAIEKEDRGAFQPLLQDPLINSLAFGASGGLILLHHLLPFG